MPLTAEEIRHGLVEFASRWDTYPGSERAEAQPFLQELLECFGTDRRAEGVLSSRMHTQWAISQSTKLKSDPRYTKASFMTFPWPRPTDEQREPIADAGRRVLARRSEICLERQIGLTKLYNEVDDGAYRDLERLHLELDEAVAAAYGWPRSAAHDPTESNRRLLELNRAIAAGEVDYDPFDRRAGAPPP